VRNKIKHWKKPRERKIEILPSGVGFAILQIMVSHYTFGIFKLFISVEKLRPQLNNRSPKPPYINSHALYK
jgi:hypothetical protein